MNRLVKLQLLPILVNLTHFSLYAITKVSRKPNYTHFNSWFQNDTFCARFSPDQNLVSLSGMGMVWSPILLTFRLCFLVCRSIFSIAEVHTCLHLPAQESREQVLQKLLCGWVNICILLSSPANILFRLPMHCNN